MTNRLCSTGFVPKDGKLIYAKRDSLVGTFQQQYQTVKVYFVCRGPNFKTHGFCVNSCLFQFDVVGGAFFRMVRI